MLGFVVRFETCEKIVKNCKIYDSPVSQYLSLVSYPVPSFTFHFILIQFCITILSPLLSFTPLWMHFHLILHLSIPLAASQRSLSATKHNTRITHRQDRHISYLLY